MISFSTPALSHVMIRVAPCADRLIAVDRRAGWSGVCRTVGQRFDEDESPLSRL